MANEMSLTSALAGVFAFKFSGFALLQARPFFLNGLGHLEIDATAI